MFIWWLVMVEIGLCIFGLKSTLGLFWFVCLFVCLACHFGPLTESNRVTQTLEIRKQSVFLRSPWFPYDLAVRKEACNLEQESHRQFGVEVNVCFQFFSGLLPVEHLGCPGLRWKVISFWSWLCNGLGFCLFVFWFSGFLFTEVDMVGQQFCGTDYLDANLEASPPVFPTRLQGPNSLY